MPLAANGEHRGNLQDQTLSHVARSGDLLLCAKNLFVDARKGFSKSSKLNGQRGNTIKLMESLTADRSERTLRKDLAPDQRAPGAKRSFAILE
jgi:hypothetical protein